VNLAGLMPSVLVFVLAMASGMIIKDQWDRRVPTIAIRDKALSTSTDG
jgi:hypothetical protein